MLAPPAHSEDFRGLFPAANDKTIHSLDELELDGSLKLAYDGEHGRNPGYLFRGELDYEIPLQTSLERRLRKDGHEITADKLQSEECRLVERFVKGEAHRILALRGESSRPMDDIFWWLSLMQHYCHPTRLIDATREIHMALFFAIEHFQKRREADVPAKIVSDHLVVYCFPCKDPKYPYDPDNNKTPFRRTGVFRTWTVDMNKVLGCYAGFEWMKHHDDSYRVEYETPANAIRKQSWGWDRPKFENPRLRVQKGMFVYPFCYPTAKSGTTSVSWFVEQLATKLADHAFNCADLSPIRILIPSSRVDALREQLERQFDLTPSTVYADLEKIRLD